MVHQVLERSVDFTNTSMQSNYSIKITPTVKRSVNQSWCTSSSFVSYCSDSCSTYPIVLLAHSIAFVSLVQTLLARAVAHHTDCCFIRVSGSELVQKYIGEGSRMVRELFVMARQHAPSIIFMDEIDSIGGTRMDSSSGGDSEVQRTMLELLNQLDGFEPSQNIKVLMATNRLDILDPALLRPGRIDRKIEFPNPSEASRLQIIKIHSRKMNLMRGINLRKIANKMKGASGAESKAVCTEAGMFALRERRVHVTQEDFEMAVAKVMKKDSDKDMSQVQFWK